MVDILNNHKFGASTKLTQKRAKESADKYKQLLNQLEPWKDLYDLMKNIWLVEYNINKYKGTDTAKQLRKKSKMIKEYINEQICSIVYP